MENVCRTCLDNRVTLVNIFSEVRDPTLNKPEKNLSFILSECTNRSVSRNDGQPQFICLSCVQAAQSAFRFKQQCDRSYKRFCQLQNKSNPLEWVLEEDQDQEDNLDSEDNDDDSEDKDIDASTKNPLLQDPVLRHFCDLCPQAFVREDNLRFHKILKHHFGDKNPAENSTKLLREWETQSSTIEESSDDHPTSRQSESGFDQDTSSGHGEKQIKLQRFECPHCSRTYKDKRGLQRHLVIHNTTPKHTCPHCPKAFWRRDHLQRHLRIHGSGCEYSCNQCSAVYSHSDSLRRHYRNAHEKRNVIKCSYCLKKYQSLESLKRHERQHSGELYRCRLCPKAFVERTLLQRHEKLVHKTEIGARKVSDQTGHKMY